MFERSKNLFKVVTFILLLMITIVSCSGGQLSKEFQDQKKLIIKMCDEISRSDYQQTYDLSQMSLELGKMLRWHSLNAHLPKSNAERIIQDKSYELSDLYYGLPYSPSYIRINNNVSPASSYTRQKIRELRDYVKSIE